MIATRDKKDVEPRCLLPIQSKVDTKLLDEAIDVIIVPDVAVALTSSESTPTVTTIDIVALAPLTSQVADLVCVPLVDDYLEPYSACVSRSIETPTIPTQVTKLVDSNLPALMDDATLTSFGQHSDSVITPLPPVTNAAAEGDAYAINQFTDFAMGAYTCGRGNNGRRGRGRGSNV
ncbi:unnamed protein product [Arabis nemorensis]|uniref:Uncharacterized protein n=1 Tax=Arabis nemorensis TaxID=586526 RepID=A0A565CG78_9BRAS|nr:unnamed protein product [Arabis nemorensis]